MKMLLATAVLLLFVCFSQVRPAFALLDEGRFSEREKVGFAFYKLAHTTPDFKSWIADSPDKTAKSPSTPSAEAQAEELKDGFSLYSTDEDLIRVETPATIIFPKLTQAQIKGNDQDQKPVQILTDNTQMLFFSYQITNSFSIAVVPANEEQLRSIMVDNSTYDKMITALGIGPYNRRAKVVLKIAFRPDHVDADKPMLLGKQYMWLMMATVADYEIWDQKRTVPLWSYSAPWYVSNDSHDLLNLYGQ